MSGFLKDEDENQTVIATRLDPKPETDVTALADTYLERVKHENAWALMWYEYLAANIVLSTTVGSLFGNAGSKRKRSERKHRKKQPKSEQKQRQKLQGS